MFTGIVEESGKLVDLRRSGHLLSVTIEGQDQVHDLKIGSSIAVNGACMTVVASKGKQFTIEVMQVSQDKTVFQLLQIGDQVNLERPLLMNGRLEGHLVMGHVDGTGEVVDMHVEAGNTFFEIKPPVHLLRYMIAHGSVTIDGISLTIADLKTETFKVCIIPHTIAVTNMKHYRVSSQVNLEVDMVGKYIERLITANRSI